MVRAYVHVMRVCVRQCWGYTVIHTYVAFGYACLYLTYTFLLIVINGHMAAQRSPGLFRMYTRPRARMLSELIESYLHPGPENPKKRFESLDPTTILAPLFGGGGGGNNNNNNSANSRNSGGAVASSSYPPPADLHRGASLASASPASTSLLTPHSNLEKGSSDYTLRL